MKPSRRWIDQRIAPALEDLVHARPADASIRLGPHRQPEGGRQLRVLVPHAQRVEVIADDGRRWDLSPARPACSRARPATRRYRCLPCISNRAWSRCTMPMRSVHCWTKPRCSGSMPVMPMRRGSWGGADAGAGHRGRALRGVGTQCPAGRGGWRFQWMGWPTSSDAAASHRRRVELFCRACRPVPATNSASSGADGRVMPDKFDPMARWAELPPATASRVPSAAPTQWHR